MAFSKYAAATVMYPHVTPVSWGNATTGRGNVRVARVKQGSENLIERATEIVGKPFKLEDYLLTHATIVSSVDVYTPPGVKTGSVLLDGFRTNRKYADFRVRPESDKFINNNLDCWSRGVLKKAYPTFIGGHNFVEHVQVEDLSKGRIIDACARDIGESLYVDILIATSRKHRDLVAAIESGKMGTLSMGCTVDGTQCTKCGHWAADETEMCPCIKYAKGNVFFDDEGHRHRIAELCGHETLDPNGGVHFIEGSWVGTPAFTGAVLRNILSPTPNISSKAAHVLNTPPPQWTDTDQKKVARVLARKFGPAKAGSSLVVSEEETTEPSPVPPTPPAASDGFKDLEDEVYKKVQDRVRERLQQDLSKDELTPEQSSSTNENLIKQGSARAYQIGLDALIRTASSDPLLVNNIAAYNAQKGVKIPVDLYRAVLKVGRHDQYKTEAAFKGACQTAMGRSVTASEVGKLLRLSMMISRRWSLGSTQQA